MVTNLVKQQILENSHSSFIIIGFFYFELYADFSQQTFPFIKWNRLVNDYGFPRNWLKKAMELTPDKEH